MPISLIIIVGCLLLIAMTSWYSLFNYGVGNIWFDIIDAVLFPLIAIGFIFRINIARLVLMAYCALIIVAGASFMTFAIYMQYVSKIEFGQFGYQPLIILAISLTAIILHAMIYLILRREKIREYFSGNYTHAT